MILQEMKELTSHQQKALDFRKHISLTANAGSGKTFVLSHRYIDIALSEKGSLSKIAAITFTDKAAAELYSKIAGQVELRYNESKDEEEKKVLSKIRRGLVSANIATIHSFCIDILRQFPVQAGLDANFQPVDEITSGELIELSVEETIKESLSGGQESDTAKYLIRLFGSKFILSSQLNYLIKDRKKIFSISEEIYDQPEEKIAAKFYTDFCLTAGKLIQIDQNEFVKALTVINEAVLSVQNSNMAALTIKNLLIEFISDVSLERKLELLHSIKENAFTKGGTIRKDGYLKNETREKLYPKILISEKYINELSVLKIPANHKEIETELAKLGKAILGLFNKAVEKYESKKRSNGYLDYEDILIHTRNLLKDRRIKTELSFRFKYIMIDEYQDTNEIQYKIFLPILDDLRTGNLFVVGDEKQSIYMFRDAEPEIFRITKRDISSTSGEKSLLSLPDSFRMAPGVCLFVNKLFRNLFSKPNEIFNEVQHSDLICAKSEDLDSLIEILIGSAENGNGGDNHQKNPEAELVAGRIISLVNRTGVPVKLNWRDIAVLVRKRRSFSSLEKIFIEKNIPFNIVGGRGFYQRQSVYDIYNYFSFILDKNNDTALVGILRSPFFSISDSLIYEISLNKGETLWQKLIQHAKKNNELNRIAEILKTSFHLSRTYNASQLLRKILKESPYLSVIAQKAEGTQEGANISKLIKLTIEFQSKGFKTLYDYVNFLKESIEETEDESQAVIADEADSVKVMTLHQAKGLEFSAVFLYNAHDVGSTGRVKKSSITLDKNFGLLTKVPLKNDYFGDYHSAPINDVYDFIASKKETAELKRLFYVGTTRAKNFLFISAPDLKSYKSNSFMHFLQEGLNIDFFRNEITLEDRLDFLKEEGNEFVNYSRLLQEKIRIRRDLNDLTPDIAKESDQDIKPDLLIQEIKDAPKGEFITATKFATFKQCPLKYQLKYDYGISDLVSRYKKFLSQKGEPPKGTFDFNSKEDEIEADSGEKKYLPAESKGSIIHKILQLNSQVNADRIRQIIKDEAPYLKDNEEINLMQKDILSQLNSLFESVVYKRINTYLKFFNEYEIYLNEKDYFLHGIIDKLIIEDKKAIIVDYKTDDIVKEKISSRAAEYFPQLEFYSYIISRLYKNLTAFELRLIFIKFPDQETVELLDRKKVAGLGNEIEKMILRLRLRDFTQNLSHCADCNFSLKNKICVVDWA